jgi:nucleotide-binding universal stress UspA family protein
MEGMSQTIVVGVDGSESSKEALRWAVQQSELTGGALEAVMSWELPSMAWLAPMPEGYNPEKEAVEALHRAVVEALGDRPAIAVQEVVTEGHPALALVERSKEADLLVVGSRGHRQFAGMLLGSVSSYCVTRAFCPVVVVRHDPD